MKLVDFMSEALIVPELESTTRDSVLEELVGHIAGVRTEIDRAVALRLLLERERLGSTGVGNGFAIPHAKLPHLPRVVGCFARSKVGVAFNSLDGRPAHLFLTLLAPEGGAGLHLKALARASRLFKDAEFRARLMEVEGRERIWAMICAEDKRLAPPSEA
jgi:nitrogen PTS system EIIA component